jgi:hypothetical protein
MAVNLSPVGGAAAQFFDNNGIPLAGGLLYTYAAGTSTPLATYTTQQATILNSNPIVLDSAGRVPNEIWLTSTYAYKFVLTNSLGAQVWSYDNLVGINSNFTAYSLQEQTFTATQGQTVFTLTGISYVPGTNNLSVFVNGSKQIVTTNYLETSSTVVTFLTGLNVGDVVDFITAISTSTTATTSNNISYTQGGTGSVTTSVQAKLQQTVSVKDFGAVGDGTTDDTTAIQAAINAVSAKTMKGVVYLPTGTYKITSALSIPYGVSIYGDGGTSSIIQAEACNALNFTSFGYSIGSMFYEDFGITANSGTNYAAVQSLNSPTSTTQDGLNFNRLRFYGWNQCFILSSTWNTSISNCRAENINNFVTLAQGNGQAVIVKISQNYIVYASGGLGTGNKYAIDAVSTSGYTETLHIFENSIYGFQICVNLAQATYVTINSNDLSASVKAIAFVTSAGGYNIVNNYIEVTGSGTGIFGAAQGSETLNTRTIIKNNYIIGTVTAAIGIQLSTVGATYQFNAAIRDNTFIGFSTYDILLYSPGKTIIDNNRCMSTAPTNSIYVGTVVGSPVILTNNYFYKLLYIDTLADFTGGKLILQNNVENNSFQSTHQSALPTTGTWRVGDIVYNNAPASGQPPGWVCTVAGTPGTWKAMSNLV